MIERQYPLFGHYYLVYVTHRESSAPSHSIYLWKHTHDRQEANHTYMMGDGYWMCYYGSASSMGSEYKFVYKENMIFKYCFDFVQPMFFELDDEEFEKHVLIYGI